MAAADIGFVLAICVSVSSVQSARNLIRALTSTNVAVRADAAEALARKKDKSATPALIKALLREPVASIRGQIVAALANSRDPASVPGLLSALKNKNSGVRTGAVRALGVIGDKRAVSTVIGTLGDKDAE